MGHPARRMIATWVRRFRAIVLPAQVMQHLRRKIIETLRYGRPRSERCQSRCRFVAPGRLDNYSCGNVGTCVVAIEIIFMDSADTSDQTPEVARWDRYCPLNSKLAYDALDWHRRINQYCSDV